MKKKDADAPAPKVSDSALTKKLAVIMTSDDTKKGEIAREKESPAAVLVAAPTAPAVAVPIAAKIEAANIEVATSNELVSFEPTSEARSDIDPATALVPIHSAVTDQKRATTANSTKRSYAERAYTACSNSYPACPNSC